MRSTRPVASSVEQAFLHPILSSRSFPVEEGEKHCVVCAAKTLVLYRASATWRLDTIKVPRPSFAPPVCMIRQTRSAHTSMERLFRFYGRVAAPVRLLANFDFFTNLEPTGGPGARPRGSRRGRDPDGGEVQLRPFQVRASGVPSSPSFSHFFFYRTLCGVPPAQTL